MWQSKDQLFSLGIYEKSSRKNQFEEYVVKQHFQKWQGLFKPQQTIELDINDL